jgi:hypothetical protein
LANFNTHITTSGLLGAAYASAGHLAYGMPLQASLLAGGLVTVAGVLPDVDSDNAVILRESLGFVALLTPMLLLDRFQELGWTNETIVLVTALTYVVIRFGVGEFLRRYTVHRGMWHSIPAALLAGMVIYYICACTDESVRLFKAGGVVTGYVWHLILDEIFAVDNSGRRPRFKRSFGTALKLWSGNTWANISTYAKLAAMLALIVLHPPHNRLHAPQYMQPQVTQPRYAPTDYPPYSVAPGYEQAPPGVPPITQPATPPPDEWNRVSSPQYRPPTR